LTAADGFLRLTMWSPFVRTDALALRAVAMMHVPAALPAIDLGLKLANEEKGAGS
jgi:hypothetical protein